MEFKATCVVDTEAINREFMELYKKLLLDMEDVIKRHTNITTQYVDVELTEKDGQA